MTNRRFVDTVGFYILLFNAEEKYVIVVVLSQRKNDFQKKQK